MRGALLLALLISFSSLPCLADCPPPVAFQWGSLGNDPGEFEGPVDVAVGPAGTVYVSDYGNNRVQMFRRDGRFISQCGIGRPGSLAVDAEGDFWVNQFVRLVKFTPQGSGAMEIHFSGSQDSLGFQSVAVSPDGLIYGLTYQPYLLFEFSPQGVQQRYWSGFPGAADVTVGPQGDVYVLGKGWVQRIRNGIQDLEWAIPGGPTVQGTRLTVGPDGSVIVATHHAIHVFTDSGALLCSWDVSMDGGIAVGPSGDLYVTDPGRHRVVMFGTRLPGDDPPPPPPVPEPPHDLGIILHIAAPDSPCAAPRRLQDVVTAAPAAPHGLRYFVYLLGTPDTRHGTEDAGVGGMQLGIAYQEASSGQPGVRVLEWHSCATMEFKGDGWPEPGTGNTITWGTSPLCPEVEIAVAGYFYVIAYGSTVMSVAPWPVTGAVKIADCRAAEERVLALNRVGWISLGGASVGTDADGCNPGLEPCAGPTPVLSTTWGRLKTLFR